MSAQNKLSVFFCKAGRISATDALPFCFPYSSPDDIDLFSGIMSEPREPGQLVGGTLACILGNQFHALKYGDRFYFETDRMPEGFTHGRLTPLVSPWQSVSKGLP